MKYFSVVLFMMLSICSLGQMKKPNVKILKKSVVVILRYDENNRYLGYGSGVIIDNNGTCITNYHVLDSVYSVKIKTEDGKEFDMNKITGENKAVDLIRFTIKKTIEKFIPVIVTKQMPEEGDDVRAIGTSGSLTNMNAITNGIVSRIDYSTGTAILQITAAIYHGSSGGGLFNSKRELIGITSSGIGGEVGARAALNYAIYIGEISKLQSVYKDRLESSVQTIAKKTEQEYKPTPELPKYEPPKYEQPKQTELPKYGSVSFYTDWSQPIEISIDWNYGTTHSFFSGKPRCGQDGTVNFSLRPGTYNYIAKGELPRFWGSTEYTWNGTVTVKPDGCELIHLPAPAGGKNKSKSSVRSWMLATDFTSFGTSAYLTKYLSSGKYNIQALWYSYDRLDPPNLNSWNKYGLDFKRVYSTNNQDLDFALNIGPSVRYLKGIYNLDYAINGSTDKIKMNDLFLNFRLGLDIIVSNRIVLRGDAGFGYATQGWNLNESKYKSTPYSNDLLKPKFTFDYDFLIGYKLGRLNQKGASKSVSGYIPLLIVPGLTDFELSRNIMLPSTKKSFVRKGKYKLIAFAGVSVLSLTSNLYSKSMYSKYKNDILPNEAYYNSANTAHKISLVSAGCASGIYLYDIIDFFTKIKTIKQNQ